MVFSGHALRTIFSVMVLFSVSKNPMKRLLFLFAWYACIGACLGRPWIVLFGSKDCDECASFKSYWVEEFTQAQDPVLVFADIDNGVNYRFLGDVEAYLKLDRKAQSFPVLLVGKRLVEGIAGYEEIEDNLDELLADPPTGPLFAQVREQVGKSKSPLLNYVHDYGETAVGESKNDGTETVDGADTSAERAEPGVSAGRVYRLLFFEQPGCQKCARQGREFELLKETFPTLEISSFDVTTLEGQAMLTRARNVFDIPDGDENLAPMVCWSVGYVTGRLATADELETALKATSGEGEFWTVPLKDEELSAEENRLEDFIGALTWWSVIGGGLLDGINPCAFATSVFLISYLLYLKRRRRDIIIVGGSFCLGVFLAYFLYGFAVSALLRQLQTWEWVRIGLYGLFSVLGFVLGVLHLRDAFKYKKSGKASDMDMGLSKETHRGIHNRIKKFTEIHSWLMAPMAVVLGAVVSSMELACTGQVYFPVLTALSGRGFSSQFVLLLFLYNVMFILPLAVITVLAGFGVGAKSLGDWAKNHVFITKVLMAVLFFGLGCLMLVMIV